MSKAWLVARQEFRQTVTTKAFWIGLLSLPVIICLAASVPVLLHQTTDARRYAVIDQSNWLLAEIDRSIYLEDLQDLAEDVADRHKINRVSHDRLPQLLRSFGADWRALSQERRAEFLRDLVAADGPNELRTWWRTVTSQELDRVGLRLSRLRFERVEPAEADQGMLNAEIAAGRLFAYFVIDADPIGAIADSGAGEYVSNNLTDRELHDWFIGHADRQVRRQRLQVQGIRPETADWLQASLPFEERRIGAGGQVAEVATKDKVRQWAPAVFTYLLWIAVFTSAQMLLTSTIEEKSARIMEVLVSSVSPTDLLAGKVIGVAGAGMIVVSVWALCLLAGMMALTQLIGPAAEGLTQVAADPYFLLAFLLYFVLGYLLYAAYLVGLGSLCTNLKETQNLMWPAMMPLMVALMSMQHIGRDPNGTMARILSFIPPLTPFVMMNRSAGPPPLWEYVATTLVLLLSVWLAVHGAARLFRVGILSTGSRPTARDVVRWLLKG